MSIINAEGRFKLLEKPLAYPFFDIVNRTPDGPVFDLGVDVDTFDGVVYITADHVVEMAKLLGMIHGEEVEHLHDKINELEAQKNRLPEGVGELVNGINELVANYHSASVSGPIGGELFDVSLLTTDGAEESSGPIPDAQKPDGQKPSASKRKGTDELPSNSSDEFGFDL
jgi:hypothetical protein